jgi:hypothetical protein
MVDLLHLNLHKSPLPFDLTPIQWHRSSTRPSFSNIRSKSYVNIIAASLTLDRLPVQWDSLRPSLCCIDGKCDVDIVLGTLPVQWNGIRVDVCGVKVEADVDIVFRCFLGTVQQ